MQNIWTLFKKEFRSYFNSPIAYIFITVFLTVMGWLVMTGFFIENQASMRSFFGLLPWAFLFFVPAATMRLWAEEKKLGTTELLMTLPVRDHEVVLGKFLASFCFVSLAVALSFSLPVTVAALGDPDPGPIIGGYLGAFLMGGAYLAIGLFVSGLTENQIVAFILGFVLCFLMFIVGAEFVLFNLPHWLVPIFKYVGLGSHFDSIGRGILDSRDIIYYLSVIGFFLWMNIRWIESRRWA
jgi:ABC-2 type transport system permease protein